ncbi:MAG: TIM barrel protein [Clostridiales bacterium]|nr:TIM barrel protein [Clostridiales bacterium]
MDMKNNIEEFALFGPAGNSEDFYEAGNRSVYQVPDWLEKNNLSAFEYQCGRGVKISDDSAQDFGKLAKEKNIRLSVHAPYYISLSSTEEEKRDNSINYILSTLNAAKHMGADRIVIHSGSCGKITRAEALALATDTLKRAIKAADQNGYGNIHLCPETMGKVKQLGNIDEVIKLCLIDERIIPTIDFGHVNAMSLGKYNTKDAIAEIFDKIYNKLGEYRAKNFHAHYSRIEYTRAGEKKHHTMAEKEYEPDFEPIAELIAERNLTPRIICESAGTQTADAVYMQNMYREFLSRI